MHTLTINNHTVENVKFHKKYDLKAVENVLNGEAKTYTSKCIIES